MIVSKTTYKSPIHRKSGNQCIMNLQNFPSQLLSCLVMTIQHFLSHSRNFLLHNLVNQLCSLYSFAVFIPETNKKFP